MLEYMPRPKTASGRRVGWSLRLSEQEAADAEAAATAAGWRTETGLHRGEWLRHLVMAAVAEHQAAPGRIRAVNDVLAQLAATPAAKSPKRQAKPKPDREQCPHRNWGRYCASCGKSIGKDGFTVAG